MMIDYCKIFYIPSPGNNPKASNSTVEALVRAMETEFPGAFPTDSWGFSTLPEETWDLKHRLFRQTPDNAAPKPVYMLGYHHILHLPHLSNAKTFCYVEQPSAPHAAPSTSEPTLLPPAFTATSICAIPESQTDAHTTTLATVMAPLWTFRQAVHVKEGQTYHLGDFSVRLGTVMSSRPAGLPPSLLAANTNSSGTVVCISRPSGDPFGDEEIAEDEAQEMAQGAGDLINRFWNQTTLRVDFGNSEVKCATMASSCFRGAKQADEATVGVWCEILRLLRA